MSPDLALGLVVEREGREGLLERREKGLVQKTEKRGVGEEWREREEKEEREAAVVAAAEAIDDIVIAEESMKVCSSGLGSDM